MRAHRSAVLVGLLVTSAALPAQAPTRRAFVSSDAVLLERRPIRSGHQVLRFATNKKPTYAGIHPYNFFFDRNSADNLLPVR